MSGRVEAAFFLIVGTALLCLSVALMFLCLALAGSLLR